MARALQYWLLIELAPNGSFFLGNEGKLAREIRKKNAGKWIADTIPSLSSQSERTLNTIHWFGIYRIYSNKRRPRISAALE